MGFAVSAVFVYLAVRDVRFRDVWVGVRESNSLWLIPAIGALALANIIRAFRWQFLFAPETRPPFKPVLSAMLIGQFFNNILPARAGDVARILALRESSGTSRAEAAGTVVAERGYDVFSVLVLLFVLLPWLPHVTWLRTSAVLAIVLLVVTLMLVAILARFGARPVRLLLHPLVRLRLASRDASERIAENLVQGLASIRRPRLVLIALVLTTLSWIVFGISAWLVVRGFDFGRDLSPAAGILVMIAVALGMTLPSSPAAVGVYEAATLVALDTYGVPHSIALSYALVLHAVNFLPYIAAGVPLSVHAAAPRRAARVESP
jgi:glycosyltransferase 2 family protein